jgi:predicted RNA-binding Zn-ribbon protein involved in translation (DUF1610 family)
MDFSLNKLTRKSLREILDNMFPLGIAGFFIGFGLSFLFVYFADVFSVLFSGIAALFGFLIYTRKPTGKQESKSDGNGMDKVREARKPCPDCGSKTIHKKDCSRRKKP